MKDLLKYLVIVAYLGGLAISIIHSILYPMATYQVFSNWTGDIITKLSAIILISGWLLTGIVIVWMLIDNHKGEGK
jgi:hypothetical protein